MSKISSYLTPENVAFLDVETQEEAVSLLVDKLDEAGKLQDKKTFLDAILQRERIVSTGIGMGVAIPHAKLPGYESFFVAIGILKKGVPWDSLDDAPVRLIFMIGGPDNKQTQYLQILSGLTLALKDEQRRKKMIKAGSANEIVKLFEAF